MRNRYIVFVVMAALSIGIVGCTRNPDTAKRKYVESGMKYMDQKKYDSAVIQFKKALQVDPKFAEAHYQLAMAQLDLQHFPDAYKELSQAVDLDHNHIKAHLQLGSLLMAARQFGKAEDPCPDPYAVTTAICEARYVVKLDPNNAEAYVLLGRALAAQKPPHQQDAVDAFTKAIELNPKDADAYVNRGMMNGYMKEDASAEQDLRKAIATDPQKLGSYADLASFYFYKKDPKKAEEVYRLAIANNPESPAPYLHLAGLLYQENRKPESEQAIQQLRDKLPTSADVAGAIGDYYLAARNPDAAIKEYQRGLKYDPKNEELQLHLLETYLTTGKIDDATKMTYSMLKDRPSDVVARITHARLLAMKGNTADAITILRGVVHDAPDNIQGHYMLGITLRQTGDLPGAKSELQEAAKQLSFKRKPDSPMILKALAETYRDSQDYDTAREYAARLQKLNENNPEAHFLNATIDIGAKDYAPALDELKEVQKSAPNDPAVHLNMAFAYAGLKKYPEAEHEFQTTTKLYPTFDTAWADYIALMFGTNQSAKALALANQYVIANPNRAQAHFINASALATAKKFDAATAEYQKVLEIDPKSVGAYVRLAQIHQIMGQPDAALDSYQKALALQPNSPVVNNAIGDLYLSKGDLKSAGKYFQAALAQNSHDPVAANNLAWVYAVQGENLDMALSLATQAKQTAPEMSAVNDTLAWIQYKKGNYRVSISLAEDAVKKEPEKADYRYHLGMALSGAGEKDRARTELQKALQLNLKGTDAQDAQKTLASLQ
jgi:tetratricopeptide (TPR) repeat protein